MAPNAQKICVLRVVCREDFSVQSAESFVEDLKQALAWLDGHFICAPQQLKALQTSIRWQGDARRAVKARWHKNARASVSFSQQLRAHNWDDLLKKQDKGVLKTWTLSMWPGYAFTHSSAAVS